VIELQGIFRPLYFVWLVNEIAWNFSYVQLFFYVDDIKLFLSVHGIQDFLKIQSNSNKLAKL
jgi:hypothetical protein